MEGLFIWFYSNPNALPKGVSAIITDRTITEEFYPKNPTRVIKEEIEKCCYVPEIYLVSEFSEVYNTCLKW